MLTVEIKVNSTCVKHVYAHNMDGLPVSKYDVVVSTPVPYGSVVPTTRRFKIKHAREKGICALVAAILDKDASLENTKDS